MLVNEKLHAAVRRNLRLKDLPMLEQQIFACTNLAPERLQFEYGPNIELLYSGGPARSKLHRRSTGGIDVHHMRRLLAEIEKSIADELCFVFLTRFEHVGALKLGLRECLLNMVQLVTVDRDTVVAVDTQSQNRLVLDFDDPGELDGKSWELCTFGDRWDDLIGSKFMA
jgi:hypothetical protein